VTDIGTKKNSNMKMQVPSTWPKTSALLKAHCHQRPYAAPYRTGFPHALSLHFLAS